MVQAFPARPAKNNGILRIYRIIGIITLVSVIDRKTFPTLSLLGKDPVLLTNRSFLGRESLQLALARGTDASLRKGTRPSPISLPRPEKQGDSR